METYYEVLGVRPSVTREGLREAMKALTMKHHPDAGGNTEEFQRYSVAYNRLRDTESRARYDLSMDLRMGRCKECDGQGETVKIYGCAPECCAACGGRGWGHV